MTTYKRFQDENTLFVKRLTKISNALANFKLFKLNYYWLSAVHDPNMSRATREGVLGSPRPPTRW